MANSTTRRNFMKSAGIAACFAPGGGISAAPSARPNILFITADDLNCDSVGAYGCKVKDITPNIDRLAAGGIRFVRGHVTAAVCQPSRSVLMTGRYPHRNGAEGFQPIRDNITTLPELLHKAGYLNGILGKEKHLAPREKFFWDLYVSQPELEQGRSPSEYYKRTTEFLAKAKAAGKPFFLMANSHDPHRPFAGSEQELRSFKKHYPVSRTIGVEEVEVPKFLPDIPDVRREIAQYFTSVHRCDETVGEVLRALKESGQEQNTLVMFLSDNGMALPFAKTNCYLHSTRTPWMARWPGRIKPGSVNAADFISGIDYMPTILEAAGLSPQEGVDGKSFLPLLQGRKQAGRDHVVTVFHETSARKRFEMRCIQSGRYGYVFNGWSDGSTVFRNESQSGLTFSAMQKAGESDPRIAQRVDFFQRRVPEEFYDFESDPAALNNLIASSGHAAGIARMRRALAEWMRATRDPLLATFTKKTGAG